MNKAIIFSLIFIASLSFVYAVPMVPTVFEGTVSYSANPVQSLVGYSINVSIGSSSYKWNVGTVGAGNHFEIMVDPQGVSGDIHFYIGNVETIETGTYIMGGFVQQDLTITSMPTDGLELYCGDGFCNNGETCSTCSIDCGSCDDDDDDDDNNGGGGGGSSSSSSNDNEVIIISNPVTSSSTGASVSNFDGTYNYTPKEQDPNPITEFLSSKELLTALAIVVVVLSLIILITPKR